MRGVCSFIKSSYFKKIPDWGLRAESRRGRPNQTDPVRDLNDLAKEINELRGKKNFVFSHPPTPLTDLLKSFALPGGDDEDLQPKGMI